MDTLPIQMDALPIQVFLTIAGMFLTLIVFRYGILKSKFDNDKTTESRLTSLETKNKDCEKTTNKVDQLTERLTRIEVKMDLFWKNLENKLADMLKSPTHLTKDILWEKFKKDIITMEEIITLNTILNEEYNQKKTFELAWMIASLETRIALSKMAEEKDCVKPS